MDYGVKIYDKPNNESMKIGCIKFKASIAMTVAIQGTFRESLYQGIRIST